MTGELAVSANDSPELLLSSRARCETPVEGVSKVRHPRPNTIIRSGKSARYILQERAAGGIAKLPNGCQRRAAETVQSMADLHSDQASRNEIYFGLCKFRDCGALRRSEFQDLTPLPFEPFTATDTRFTRAVCLVSQAARWPPMTHLVRNNSRRRPLTRQSLGCCRPSREGCESNPDRHLVTIAAISDLASVYMPPRAPRNEQFHAASFWPKSSARTI
jgi:hypothetical protein